MTPMDVTMKIRNIDLGERPVVLAPMEDVTDPAFRLMCKRFGADMVYTEFVSADALIRSVNKTMAKLNIDEQERPVAIQIYGKDVPTMVEAAKIVEEAKPDILDLNFGCPVKRVAGKGAGLRVMNLHTGSRGKRHHRGCCCETLHKHVYSTCIEHCKLAYNPHIATFAQESHIVALLNAKRPIARTISSSPNRLSSMEATRSVAVGVLVTT